MEIKKFLQLLARYKYVLIIIPAVTIVITYFLVHNMPDSYSSQAQLATGIVDATQQDIGAEIKLPAESEITQEFNNLIEMLKLKKIIDQVSYKLIIHDLTSKTPFRARSAKVKELNAEAIKHAIQIYSEKYKKRESLNLWDGDQNGLYEVLRSMRYNEEAIKQSLLIYRGGNGDFINIEFSSENPDLSAFVANTLSEEFISYYTTLVKENQHKSVDYLSRLLKEKKDSMNNKIAGLRDYKIRNRVLNLYEQSKSLYNLLMDFESKREQAKKDIVAYSGALANIDNKFNPQDRKYIDAAYTKINQDILITKDRMRSLSDQYIQSGFNPGYKNRMDSLQNVLTGQIGNLTDKYITNPLNAKEDLITQKLTLEIQRDIAKNSVQSLNDEIASLNARFNSLVPNEAVEQSYNRDIDVATSEYMDVLNKFNQTDMESEYSIKLKQVQVAMPGLALPSKKMLLIILSGIISFVFCVIVLFIAFYLDNSIGEPKQLANKTDLPVLGSLPLLEGNLLDISRIWRDQQHHTGIQSFKEQLRDIRFEIEKELGGQSKIIGITSITNGEGKTFFSINLAYAYSMIGKKVLLIDGNLNNSAISRFIKPAHYIEDVFQDKISLFELNSENSVSILGNRGGDRSLLEISSEPHIHQMFRTLENMFDIILIDMTGLDTMSKSKEWFLFIQKVTAIFEAGQSMTDSKLQHVAYLKGLHHKFSGWVLNKTSGNQTN